jgi:hypothetical protein
MTKAQDEFDLDTLLSVWFDLERALEGKNGYGGDVAEIYAYRCVPEHLRQHDSHEEAVKLAQTAGRNLTRLLRHFVELHEDVEIGIETDPREFRPIDPRTEPFPAFDHRVHIRISRVQQLRLRFARELLALWERASDDGIEAQPDFAAWSGATKDLLLGLGMEWDTASAAYVFRRKP